jgi:cysteine-rich repeat protein
MVPYPIGEVPIVIEAELVGATVHDDDDDTADAGGFTSVAVQPFNPCSDGDACTTDVCNCLTSACSYVPAVCNDQDLCTSDSCKPEDGTCQFVDVVTPTCTDDGLACTDEVCDPATGQCVHRNACSDDQNACTSDDCTANGCVHVDAPYPGCELCYDGTVNAGESCDDGPLTGTLGSCCGKDCVVKPAIAVCRSSTGACDPTERCDGVGSACPADALATGGICRASLGVCDPAETCTGTSTTCPPERLAGPDQTCRLGGVCDLAEHCDGAGIACPPDAFVAEGEACGPQSPGNVCDGAGVCLGMCGNGVPDSALEQCDDGNDAPGDGCRPDCTSEQCGDQRSDPREQCDGDKGCDTTCRRQCTSDGACPVVPCSTGICDRGLCTAEPGCAGDPCTGSEVSLDALTCALDRSLGGAPCNTRDGRDASRRVRREVIRATKLIARDLRRCSSRYAGLAVGLRRRTAIARLVRDLSRTRERLVQLDRRLRNERRKIGEQCLSLLRGVRSGDARLLNLLERIDAVRLEDACGGAAA